MEGGRQNFSRPNRPLFGMAPDLNDEIYQRYLHQQQLNLTPQSNEYIAPNPIHNVDSSSIPTPPRQVRGMGRPQFMPPLPDGLTLSSLPPAPKIRPRPSNAPLPSEEVLARPHVLADQRQRLSSNLTTDSRTSSPGHLEMLAEDGQDQRVPQLERKGARRRNMSKMGGEESSVLPDGAPLGHRQTQSVGDLGRPPVVREKVRRRPPASQMAEQLGAPIQGVPPQMMQGASPQTMQSGSPRTHQLPHDAHVDNNSPLQMRSSASPVVNKKMPRREGSHEQIPHQPTDQGDQTEKPSLQRQFSFESLPNAPLTALPQTQRGGRKKVKVGERSAPRGPPNTTFGPYEAFNATSPHGPAGSNATLINPSNTSLDQQHQGGGRPRRPTNTSSNHDSSSMGSPAPQTSRGPATFNDMGADDEAFKKSLNDQDERSPVTKVFNRVGGMNIPKVRLGRRAQNVEPSFSRIQGKQVNDVNLDQRAQEDPNLTAILKMKAQIEAEKRQNTPIPRARPQTPPIGQHMSAAERRQRYAPTQEIPKPANASTAMDKPKGLQKPLIPRKTAFIESIHPLDNANEDEIERHHEEIEHKKLHSGRDRPKMIMLSNVARGIRQDYDAHRAKYGANPEDPSKIRRRSSFVAPGYGFNGTGPAKKSNAVVAVPNITKGRVRLQRKASQALTSRPGAPESRPSSAAGKRLKKK